MQGKFVLKREDNTVNILPHKKCRGGWCEEAGHQGQVYVPKDWQQYLAHVLLCSEEQW